MIILMVVKVIIFQLINNSQVVVDVEDYLKNINVQSILEVDLVMLIFNHFKMLMLLSMIIQLLFKI